MLSDGDTSVTQPTNSTKQEISKKRKREKFAAEGRGTTVYPPKVLQVSALLNGKEEQLG